MYFDLFITVINVLIGSDFYWSIVTGQVKQGDRGPTVVGSKLGWLLSGPADQSTTEFFSSYSAITHVSNDPKISDYLASTLRKFWETDSIGIVDRQNSDPFVEIPFVEDIQFVDGRYEVSLPWKEESPEISNHYQLSLNREVSSTSLFEKSRNNVRVQSYYSRAVDQGNHGRSSRIVLNK